MFRQSPKSWITLVAIGPNNKEIIKIKKIKRWAIRIIIKIPWTVSESAGGVGGFGIDFGSEHGPGQTSSPIENGIWGGVG